MTATTYPSKKSFVNSSVEANQGTAIQTNPWTHPLNAFSPEDDPRWLDDMAQRGSMVGVYGSQMGSKSIKFSIPDTPLFPDGIGYFLDNLLGDTASTGPVSSVYTHVLSVLNSGTAQPRTHSITQWQGLTASTSARTYTGCVITELTIKGSAESEYVTFSAKGVGWSSAAAATLPVSAPTSVVPLPGWRVKVGIGGPASGGTQVLYTGPWSVTIKREVDIEFTNQNAQTPYIIQRGEVTVDWTLDVIKPSDETVLNYMLNNTQGQLQFDVDNGVVGAGHLQVTINMSKAQWRSVPIDFSEAAIGYKASGMGLANTTDAGASGGYSPIKITLQNAVSVYTS